MFIRKNERKMLGESAFTLIELLAVIVIIGIIAVITIPVLTKAIENSKKGVAKNSAYGYKDSIDNFYYSQSVDDASFALANKRYDSSELRNLGLSISGDEPDANSWIDIVDNDIIDGCLQFGKYMVDVGYDYVGEVSKGECASVGSWEQTIYPVVFETVGDTTYYDASWIKETPVYYNPVTNTTCNSASSNSTLGTASGCMKWYAYSESNGKVNMILDHNLTNSINWVDYFSTGKTEFEVLSEILDDRTSNWSDRLIRSDSYNANWNYNNTDYSISLDYSDKKARFISAEEIAKLAGNFSWSNSGDSFYFGSMSFGDNDGYYYQSESEKSRQESFSWLFENTHECDYFGCDSPQSGVYGYWTSTPKTNTSSSVWCICNGGCLDSTDVSVSYIGLRPVISVSKSSVY